MKYLVLAAVLTLSACQCGGTPPIAESHEPVTLSTAALPAGTVGLRYAAGLEVAGGQAPFAFAVTEGVLPSGLTLDAASGALSGVPLAAGGSAFTVEVSDAVQGRSARAFYLEVTGGAFQLLTTTLPAGEVGKPYAVELLASGGAPPYTWSVVSGELPAGLSLSPDGVLAGTPLVAGASGFTLEVADLATPPALATTTLSVTIHSASPGASPLQVTTSTLPPATVGSAYSAQLATSGGTPPITWAVAAGSSLPPGMTLTPNGLVGGAPTAAGQFETTFLAVDGAAPPQNASAALKLAVTSPSNPLTLETGGLPSGVVGVAYARQLAATGGTPPYTWTVPAGDLPHGLSLAASGALSGTPDTAGTFAFNAQVRDAAPAPRVAQGTYSLTIHWNPSQVVTITTGALPLGVVGGEYLTQLKAAGGLEPYAWAITEGQLPNGLSVCGVGCLSGTPTMPGAFLFSVEAKDRSTPAHAARKQFTLTVVSPSSQTLGISTPTLPNGRVGAPYEQAVSVSGGTPPYTFSLVAGGIPAGVQLGAVGTLTGVPTTAGTYNFTLRVTDSAASPNLAHRSFQVTVAP